jgi:hypothetical protein
MNFSTDVGSQFGDFGVFQKVGKLGISVLAMIGVCEGLERLVICVSCQY